MNTLKLLSNLSIPLILCIVPICALAKGVNLLSAFSQGVLSGLNILLEMFPALLLLTLAIAAFQSSGAMELLSRSLAVPAQLAGIPQELIPLTLLRPLSGSGALAVFTNLLSQYGPDSLIGRTASVLMGSTETTFYTIALYCSASGIRKSRWATPASLCADLTGFLISALAVRRIFS